MGLLGSKNNQILVKNCDLIWFKKTIKSLNKWGKLFRFASRINVLKLTSIQGADLIGVSLPSGPVAKFFWSW